MTKEEARARLKKQIKAEYGTEKSFAVAMGWQRQKASYLVNGHYVPNVRKSIRLLRRCGWTWETC